MELEVEMLHLVSDGVGGGGGQKDERKRMEALMEKEVKEDDDDAWVRGRLLVCERSLRSMTMDNPVCEEKEDSEMRRKREGAMH